MTTEVTAADREAAVRVNNLAARLEPEQILQMPVSVYRAALATVRAKQVEAEGCIVEAAQLASQVQFDRAEALQARVTALEAALREVVRVSMEVRVRDIAEKALAPDCQHGLPMRKVLND